MLVSIISFIGVIWTLIVHFIKYVLNKSDIDVTMIPDIAHPTDFMSLSDGVMYEGLLKDYSKHYVKR